MKEKIVFLASTMVMAPLVTLAASNPDRCDSIANSGTIQGVICKLSEILSAVLPFLIALGVVFFVWGVISYVIAGDEEAKTAGRDRMIFGIIGLAVIIGVWGLVKIVTNTFELTSQGSISLPVLPN